MSDVVTLARLARESLARGLSALQDPHIPPQLAELAAPIAQAMGALHQIRALGRGSGHARRSDRAHQHSGRLDPAANAAPAAPGRHGCDGGGRRCLRQRAQSDALRPCCRPSTGEGSGPPGGGLRSAASRCLCAASGPTGRLRSTGLPAACSAAASASWRLRGPTSASGAGPRGLATRGGAEG